MASLPDRQLLVEDTHDITKNKLISKLRTAKVSFNPLSLKPTLQALWTLYNLGFLEEKTIADGEIVEMVAKLWSTTSDKLAANVAVMKLDTPGDRPRKAHHIGTLVIAFMEKQRRKPHMTCQDDGSQSSTVNQFKQLTITPPKSEIPLNIFKLFTSIRSNPDVISLLLGSAFDLTRSHLESATKVDFPGTSIKISAKDLTDTPCNMTTEMSDIKLASVLQDLPNHMQELVAHICSKYTPMLKLATNDYRISGFPESVHQFIFKSSTSSKKADLRKGGTAGSGRMVLFHGTNLFFLPAILSGGLKATSHAYGHLRSTLWTAEAPKTSWSYADRNEHYRNYYKQQYSITHKHPYYDCGVLFACEYSKIRKPDEMFGDDEPVHILGQKELAFLTIRYVFIIPFKVIHKKRPILNTKDIQSKMLKAFELPEFQAD